MYYTLTLLKRSEVVCEVTAVAQKVGSLRYATERHYYGERDRARLGGARRITRQTQIIKIWAVNTATARKQTLAAKERLE